MLGSVVLVAMLVAPLAGKGSDRFRPTALRARCGLCGARPSGPDLHAAAPAALAARAAHGADRRRARPVPRAQRQAAHAGCAVAAPGEGLRPGRHAAPGRLRARVRDRGEPHDMDAGAARVRLGRPRGKGDAARRSAALRADLPARRSLVHRGPDAGAASRGTAGSGDPPDRSGVLDSWRELTAAPPRPGGGCIGRVHGAGHSRAARALHRSRYEHRSLHPSRGGPATGGAFRHGFAGAHRAVRSTGHARQRRRRRNLRGPVRGLPR